MVRTILANRKLEVYVTELAKDKKFCYGVIAGQTSSLNKDYVVHLAKTLEPPENLSNAAVDDKSTATITKPNLSVATDGENEKLVEETVENFDGQNLINHSVSVTRMIPGSFYVLGAFAVTENSIFQDNESVNKFKTLFQEMSRALELNKFFCGHPPNHENNGKLLLNYIMSSETFECKSFDSMGANPIPADWKFLDKPTVWHMFETNYDLDDIFPIKEHEKSLNLENNFLISLEYIREYIACSEIFVQNENVDENQSLESYIKDKLSRKESVDSFKASILQSTTFTPKCPPTIEEFHGTIRYIGTIYSRIWAHQKSSFKDIQTFIRNDIIRSLAARIQTFCDGLTEPHASNDAIVVNIPPKRVFFDIPDSGGIQFSEYIFNGENVYTVVDQAKELLDLIIEEDHVAMEIETLPDYNDAISIYAHQSTPAIGDNVEQNGKLESKRFLYYGGIVIALAMLVLSILLHYIWR